MSEVISFRLDRDHPREGQALEVLRKGQKAGYSTRHLLTEALLALAAAAADEQAAAQALAEVAERLGHIQSMLERLQHTGLAPVPPQEDMPQQSVLSEAFLLSVKSAAKPGLAANR